MLRNLTFILAAAATLSIAQIAPPAIARADEPLIDDPYFHVRNTVGATGEFDSSRVSPAPLVGTAIGKAIGESANDGDEDAAAEEKEPPQRHRKP